MKVSYSVQALLIGGMWTHKFFLCAT